MTGKGQVNRNGCTNQKKKQVRSSEEQHASRDVPGLSVVASASVSSISNLGSSEISISYNESSAVRGFVRTDIYPLKKKIFCDSEIGYGSTLARRVVESMMYDMDGFYRRKKDPSYKVRKVNEMAFWARNQQTVRKVLREKVNNSLTRYRNKMESK